MWSGCLQDGRRKGQDILPLCLGCFGGWFLGLQDEHAKWFLWHNQTRKTFYFSCINAGQEESTERSMKVTLYHPPTTIESTQCYILIQTLKLEWEWHSASCNTHPVVAYFSWTTGGLVIHLGWGVIHNITPSQLLHNRSFQSPSQLQTIF